VVLPPTQFSVAAERLLSATPSKSRVITGGAASATASAAQAAAAAARQSDLIAEGG